MKRAALLSLLVLTATACGATPPTVSFDANGKPTVAVAQTAAITPEQLKAFGLGKYPIEQATVTGSVDSNGQQEHGLTFKVKGCTALFQLTPGATGYKLTADGNDISTDMSSQNPNEIYVLAVADAINAAVTTPAKYGCDAATVREAAKKVGITTS